MITTGKNIHKKNILALHLRVFRLLFLVGEICVSMHDVQNIKQEKMEIFTETALSKKTSILAFRK